MVRTLQGKRSKKSRSIPNGRRTSSVSVNTHVEDFFSAGGTRLLLVRCAWAIAIIATAAAVHMHSRSLHSAGGLWRDEVNSENVATLPSLHVMWETLPHDSFPILFPAALRVWSTTVGESDISLRYLGLAIGLLLLASLWVAGWMIWRGPPLLSSTLFALNVMVIRYGDSLRAYGLAVACIVLTLAATWRFVEAPSLSAGTIAATLATLSVQTLYQNAFLVLAICAAGAVVHLLQKRVLSALQVLTIGVVPALSLTPYVRPLLRAQDWWILQKYGLTLEAMKANISSITGYPLGFFSYVWAFLIVAAIGLRIQCAVSKTFNNDGQRQDPTLFAALALVLGLIGFGVFLFIAKLPTQPWYYLPAIGFAIVCCDAILSSSYASVRIGVLIAAAVVAVIAYPAGLSKLEFRQTNGDLVAQRLSQQATREDLIVVNPWYYGVTFARYYYGSAPWTTLAGFEDYRYHRYDLLKSKMQLDHPAQPVLERVAATLKSGHNVWVAGWVPVVKSPPPDLPPAPNSSYGWMDEPYTQTWGAQLYYLLATQAKHAEVVPQHSDSKINPYEDMQLIVADGWR